jgi:hypothetical protein
MEFLGFASLEFLSNLKKFHSSFISLNVFLCLFPTSLQNPRLMYMRPFHAVQISLGTVHFLHSLLHVCFILFSFCHCVFKSFILSSAISNLLIPSIILTLKKCSFHVWKFRLDHVHVFCSSS